MRTKHRLLDRSGQPIRRADVAIFVAGRGGTAGEPAIRARAGDDGMLEFDLADTLAGENLVVVVSDPDSGETLHIAPTGFDSLPDTLRTIDRAAPAGGMSMPASETLAPMETRKRVPLAQSLRERNRNEARLRNAVDTATRAERQAGLLQKRQARAFAGRFAGRKPLRGRSTGALFVPAAEAADKAIARGREAGLERLARSKPRGVLLRPGDDSEAADLEKTLSRLTDDEAALPPHLQALQRCAAERAATAAAGTGTAEAAAIAASEEVPVDLRQQLQAIFDKDATAPGGRPTADSVRAALARNVPSGPADVDAFYDYNALQVAWRDAWTATFDRHAEQRVRELYESVVEVLPRDEIEADLSEIDELHDLLDLLGDAVATASKAMSAPADLLAWMPEIGEAWNRLGFSDQEYLRFLQAADEVLQSIRQQLTNPMTTGVTIARYGLRSLAQLDGFDGYPDAWMPNEPVITLAMRPNWAEDAAHAVLNGVSGEGRDTRLGRAERLLRELRKALAAPYQFDVFASGAHNYGVLTTYRQRWRPLSYQAGDLAGAIALAPNEKRRYRIEKKITRKESRTSSVDLLSAGTTESSESHRAESEITRAAQQKMSSKLTAGYSKGVKDVWNIHAIAEFAGEQGSQSSKIKKAIRESTRKATQEFRDQRKVEVAASSEYQETVEESRELSNPNNELTVTYLFYELQRRYEVSERLHRVQPVVLVAFDMPAPHEIDEAFLLQHDWIIDRVLLDDSFRAALRHIRTSFAGDEVAVEALGEQWRAQLALVAAMRRQAGAHQNLRDEAREAVERAARETALFGAVSDTKGGGVGWRLARRIFEAAEQYSEGNEAVLAQSLDWADADLAQIEAAAREAATALERATEAYVEAVRNRLNRRTAIDRLLLHVKQNIFHYMQAIWQYEHEDQRYLRLYEQDVTWPTPDGSAQLVTHVSAATAAMPPSMPEIAKPPEHLALLPRPSLGETRVLHEIADLDRLLGFRGNLAIFPLRESNALTDFMAQDFLDSHFGIVDPDPLGAQPTAQEAIQLAGCAWRQPETGEDERAAITEWLIATLEAAYKVSEEVIVPTGEVFIEALPGSHPLLEDFKLAHRLHDARKAGAQADLAQVEVLRRAMRLEAGNLGDPDIDRLVRVTGASQVTVEDGED